MWGAAVSWYHCGNREGTRKVIEMRRREVIAVAIAGSGELHITWFKGDSVSCELLARFRANDVRASCVADGDDLSLGRPALRLRALDPHFRTGGERTEGPARVLDWSSWWFQRRGCFQYGR